MKLNFGAVLVAFGFFVTELYSDRASIKIIMQVSKYQEYAAAFARRRRQASPISDFRCAMILFTSLARDANRKDVGAEENDVR